jgi:hypothetical protein
LRFQSWKPEVLNVWSETKKTIINFILKLKIMKLNKFKIITFALNVVATVSCNKDDNNNDSMAMESIDFSGTYLQQDQMARPAINTCFIAWGSLKTILMQLFLCNGSKIPAYF